jgi:VWFA-related protein
MTRRGLLKSAAALCGAPLAWSLSPDQDQQPTFTTNVKVVNVLATVRNKTGALIGNLNKDDFALAEDGRPQTIRYFLHESDLPLTLGLMVDTSGSQWKVLDEERGASLRFLDHVFRENKDHVFIMQFDSSLQVKQQLTGSIKKLDDAMAYVDGETMKQIRMQGGGGTLLYDAVVRASDTIMKKQTGRKGLIVLSDGVDFGSEASLEDAIEAAQRAETLVYSIVCSDPGAYGIFGGDHDGRKVLQRLSDESGGSCFEPSKKQSLESMFDILEEELRNQYSIGYVSDKPVTISEFRNIQLTAKQKGLQVRARKRYWAQR